jgi:hypothetical protein
MISRPWLVVKADAGRLLEPAECRGLKQIENDVHNFGDECLTARGECSREQVYSSTTAAFYLLTCKCTGEGEN